MQGSLKFHSALINDLHDDVICNIANCAEATALYCQYVQTSNLQWLEFQNLNLTVDTQLFGVAC